MVGLGHYRHSSESFNAPKSIGTIIARNVHHAEVTPTKKKADAYKNYRSVSALLIWKEVGGGVVGDFPLNDEDENVAAPEKEEEGESSSETDSDASFPDVEIPGTWGTHGLELKPWDDETKPVVCFNELREGDKSDLAEFGVLTDRIVATGSTYLDRSPETGGFCLCKLNLPNRVRIFAQSINTLFIIQRLN